MAIDIDLATASDDVYGDLYCIGKDREIKVEIDLGSVTLPETKLINVNFFFWGNLAEITAPTPISIGGLPDGYNFQWGGNVTNGTALLTGTAAHLWENVKVVYDWASSADLLDLTVQMLHTFDLKSWITDNVSRDNNSRLWRSKFNDPTEFTITPGTIYDSWVNNNPLLGVRVRVYDITDTGYTFVEQELKTFYRNDMFFWNPVSPTDEFNEWPYVGVKSYQWELTRNTIPVSTLSTTEDTHVKLTLEVHPVGVVSDGSEFDEYYQAALVCIDPPGSNGSQYFADLPMAYTTYNGSFGQVPPFTQTINGVVPFHNGTGFTEVSTDVWEIEFDVKKEAIEAGKRYRLYVVAKNLWTPPPI